MFSKKISRRNFLKASAITTARAAVGLPAFAEQPEDENCIKTGLDIPRATGSTVDKGVLLNESRLYSITDFGAVSEGDPIQNTEAINKAIQTASDAGGGTVVVPAGDFKSYTIRLQSGVNFRIDANGIIRAARADLYDWNGNQTMVGEGGNYDEPEVNLYAGLQDHGHTYFANSLFYAADKHDIMIYGEGLIDGSYMDDTGTLINVLSGNDPLQPQEPHRPGPQRHLVRQQGHCTGALRERGAGRHPHPERRPLCHYRRGHQEHDRQRFDCGHQP